MLKSDSALLTFIKVYVSVLLWVPFLLVFEFHLFSTINKLKILRDLFLIIVFILLSLNYITKNKLNIDKISLYILSTITYIFTKLLVEGINIPNLYTVRLFILNTGILFNYFLKDKRNRNKIIKFTKHNLTFLIIIGSLVWLLPNSFLYEIIYTETYRSLSYPLVGREYYLDIIQSAKDDGKFGFYREINGLIFTRNFGPYFSPLTLAFSCLLIYLLSDQKHTKVLASIILYTSFTRSIIVLQLIDMMFKSKIKHLTFSFFCLILVLYSDEIYRLIFDSSTAHHIFVYLNIPIEFSLFGNLASASIGARFNNLEILIGESLYLSLISCFGLFGFMIYLGLFLLTYFSLENLKYKYLLISILLIGITSEVVLGVTGYGIAYLLLGLSILRGRSSI